MNLAVGIVGLPNVGKSTLFNVLTKQSIPAENYPFCTIDPNVGIVPVTDFRLQELAEFVQPAETVPAVVEFFDIAGLVRGAHKGEGLGNEFLGHIRNSQIILHLIRNFSDDKVIHVDNKVDPLSDKQTIETELLLKDLDSIEKQAAKLTREVKSEKNKQKFLDMVLLIKKVLEEGQLANTLSWEQFDLEAKKYREEMFLLTDKKIIYAINGDWDNPQAQADLVRLREQLQIPEHAKILPINIKLEAEIAALSEADQHEFKQELGIEVGSIDMLTKACYEELNLISFFTAGPKEVRAWTIEKGFTAKQAAGVIHNDFEAKFITAEVAHYADFVANTGWQGAKNAGKVRLEGKDYLVVDGDLMIFRHGA